MKFDKNDRSALAGTVLFHLAVFLLLLCLAPLRTVMPEDGGVLVNFGNLNMAAGVFEPRGQRAPVSTPVPEVTPPKTTRPVPPPRAEMITQDEEETVTLTDRKEEERKKREEAERKKREEERLAEQRRREEQRRQSQAIQNQVAGAFGSGNADGGSQGDAPAGTGNQGNPFGNSDSGANEGAGGNGTFFDLNGRSIGAGGLPRPSYTGQEEGRIVISITVDPKGNVIMAEIGRGTNIVDGTMRSAALGAAKRAKFNSIVGTNNQSGTITYHYRYLSN
ncbi:MAG: energy transducer TonB [Tannerella sp.]|jgi:TonB family protein|nr:energy transducer TonB [Tannerella sp.]